MKRLVRRIGGQAAVEAMYCLPVMLLVYLVGANLWQITWNAQYAHIKARRNLHDTLAHKPCRSNNDGTGALGGETVGTARAVTNPQPYYGGRFMRNEGRRTLKAKATVICR